MESRIFKLMCLIAVAETWVSSDVSTNGKVVIEGPSYFVTDGTRWLTLRATATNMGLSPDYAWSGLCSSNTDTCTIQPRLDQDGETVLCAATNPDTLQSVNAQYSLHLLYPPAEAPMILNSTTGEAPSPGVNLTLGDELTCTVSGGKPLVTVVNFTCTNPFLPDQNDVNDTYSVSSSVTVDVRGATEGPMVCTCSAVWSPDPALYRKEQTITFTVQTPSSQDKASSTTDRHWTEMTSQTNEGTLGLDAEDNTVLIIVIPCVLLIAGLIVVIAIIIFVYRSRKKETRAQHYSTESGTGKPPLQGPSAVITEDPKPKQGTEKTSGTGTGKPPLQGPSAVITEDPKPKQGTEKTSGTGTGKPPLQGPSAVITEDPKPKQGTEKTSDNKQVQVSTGSDAESGDDTQTIKKHEDSSPNADDSMNSNHVEGSDDSRSSTSSDGSNDSAKQLIKTGKDNEAMK